MTTFCCAPMTEQVQFECPQHADARDCPDKLIDYVPKFNEYGLLVHDGEDGHGSSFAVIAYCPWCGSALGPTYRDQWFDTLAQRGLEPEDELPDELTDDRWWRADVATPSVRRR